MNHSSPTNRFHKTSHIFILERAKPKRVSNFHPENIHFSSCWATLVTIRSSLRLFQRKLLSRSGRIELVAVLALRLQPTRKDFPHFGMRLPHPSPRKFDLLRCNAGPRLSAAGLTTPRSNQFIGGQTLHQAFPWSASCCNMLSRHRAGITRKRYFRSRPRNASEPCCCTSTQNREAVQ